MELGGYKQETGITLAGAVKMASGIDNRGMGHAPLANGQDITTARPLYGTAHNNGIGQTMNIATSRQVAIWTTTLNTALEQGGAGATLKVKEYGAPPFESRSGLRSKVEL